MGGLRTPWNPSQMITSEPQSPIHSEGFPNKHYVPFDAASPTAMLWYTGLLSVATSCPVLD